MKQRNGFVSNSSSSSFIVAAKKDIDENEYTFLNKTGTDNVLKFANEQQFDKEESESMINNISKYNNDKWFFAMFNLSIHDTNSLTKLKNAETAEEIVVIGYIDH